MSDHHPVIVGDGCIEIKRNFSTLPIEPGFVQMCATLREGCKREQCDGHHCKYTSSWQYGHMKVCTHLTCRACLPWLSAREHLYSSDATTTLTTAPAAGSQLVSAAAAAQRIETTSTITSVMQLQCCHSSIMAWQLAHEILRLCNYAAAAEHSDSYLATQCLFKSHQIAVGRF